MLTPFINKLTLKNYKSTPHELQEEVQVGKIFWQLLQSQNFICSASRRISWQIRQPADF